MTDFLNVAGRTFLVTGGTRGLGAATAALLHEHGAHVTIIGRDGVTLDRALDRLGNDRVLGWQGDLSNPQCVTDVISATLQSFGSLDGLFLNTGGPAPSSAIDTTDNDWTSGFTSVFLAPLRALRMAVDHLTDPDASVVFNLSTSVYRPLTNLAVSNAFRPALANLIRQLADELGPRGIRVNGIAPGRIATGRVRDLDARAGDPDTVRAQREENIPLRRYGQPHEFAAAAAFLLSPAASYVTGTVLGVDGGAGLNP